MLGLYEQPFAVALDLRLDLRLGSDVPDTTRVGFTVCSRRLYTPTSSTAHGGTVLAIQRDCQTGRLVGAGMSTRSPTNGSGGVREAVRRQRKMVVL